MAQHTLTMTVNGDPATVSVPSHFTLLQMLRDTLALTGTKNGCAAGECGACTVMMDGEPVNSCMVLAVECDGARIDTVESLAHDSQLDPIQAAFIETSAVQCGFCTPGVLVSTRALLDRNPSPTDAEIREALVGNLCRCTGYLSIIKAVRKSVSTPAEAEV